MHKANILKFSSGMFLDVFVRSGKNYPQIETDDKSSTTWRCSW